MRGWSNQRIHEQIAGYFFILPNLLGVVLFVAVPLLFSLILVFMDWDYLRGLNGLAFTGLDNIPSDHCNIAWPGRLPLGSEANA